MDKTLTNTITISGDFTIEDLRWLVQQTEGYVSNSTVTVKQATSFPGDDYPAQISVTNTVKLR